MSNSSQSLIAKIVSSTLSNEWQPSVLTEGTSMFIYVSKFDMGWAKSSRARRS